MTSRPSNATAIGSAQRLRGGFACSLARIPHQAPKQCASPESALRDRLQQHKFLGPNGDASGPYSPQRARASPEIGQPGRVLVVTAAGLAWDASAPTDSSRWIAKAGFNPHVIIACCLRTPICRGGGTIQSPWNSPADPNPVNKMNEQKTRARYRRGNG